MCLVVGKAVQPGIERRWSLENGQYTGNIRIG